jgi:Uma2 family endonuclease
MAVLTSPPSRVTEDTPVIATDTPILFEDEGQEEMGDSYPHTTTATIIYFGLRAFFADRPTHRVFADMNLHYSTLRPAAYVSPDVMVVVPFGPLPNDVASYRIEDQGPAPVFVTEVLSHRTAQQGDLTLKPKVYADVEVPEYCLINPTGEYLSNRLELRTLAPGRKAKWESAVDRGQGVTSRLGFRIEMEADGWPRVIDVATGRRYPRPDEVAALAEAERKLEREIEARQAAEAEIVRLRALLAEKSK